MYRIWIYNLIPIRQALRLGRRIGGGDLEFSTELTIQLTIELAIDLSHESTWNHMDRHGLTSINMNEHGLAWANMD